MTAAPSVADKAIAFSKAMVDCYWMTRAKATVSQGLGAYDLRERLAYSLGASAYETLTRSLLGDLIRSTWAFTLDRDARAPSVANLWAMVANPELRVDLRERYCDASHLDAGQPEWSAGARANFDETLNRLDGAIPKFLESEAAQRMNKARNRAVAHYNMIPVDDDSYELFDVADLDLRLRHPHEFLDLAEPIILDLAALLTRTSYAVEEYKLTYELQALDFWSRVMGKGTVELELAKVTPQR